MMSFIIMASDCCSAWPDPMSVQLLFIFSIRFILVTGWWSVRTPFWEYCVEGEDTPGHSLPQGAI